MFLLYAGVASLLFLWFLGLDKVTESSYPFYIRTMSLNRNYFIAYWIAFGPHGPRKLPPPGEGWYVFKWTMVGLGVSVIVFVIIRSFARGDPKTMNEQYQKMTNEYLKVGLHLQQYMPQAPFLISP